MLFGLLLMLDVAPEAAVVVWVLVLVVPGVVCGLGSCGKTLWESHNVTCTRRRAVARMQFAATPATIGQGSFATRETSVIKNER